MMPLSPGQMNLFYTRADKISPELLSRYQSVLSPDEIQKANRYRAPRDRLLCLTARALVRYLISEYTGLDPAALSFTVNDYGKPALDPDLQDFTGLKSGRIKFNLSHCKGAVVCAVCLDHDLGVDVEDLGRRVDPALADRFFSLQEATWVRSQGEEGTLQERFLEIWTLKEAYIKAKGKGLAIPLTSFSFHLAENKIKIHFEDSEQNGGAEEGAWQFFRWYPEPDKIVAAAVRAEWSFDIQTYHCVPFEGVYA